MSYSAYSARSDPFASEAIFRVHLSDGEARKGEWNTSSCDTESPEQTIDRILREK